MPVCVIAGYRIHLEFPLLFLFFAFMLSDSVFTNLIIYRTCYVTLGYNQSECALLGSKNGDNSTANLEKLVEPHASVIKMVHFVIDQGFSVLVCLFIGPWSDRFGRRLLLLLPLLGFIASYLLVAVCSEIPNLSPWFFLVCGIPTMLTGGFSTYLTGALSYVADVTTETNRGLRMGSVEAALSIGILLGNVSSSYVFYATYYWTIFVISALCCSIAFLFTYFFIEESLIDRETEGKVKGIFQLSNIGDMIKTTFKQRQQYDRCVVICCIISLTIYIFVIQGDGGVTFLYLREKFHWSLEKYTLYSAVHNITNIAGTIVGVYMIHKLLKVPETIMILIGYISVFNSALMQGLATKDYTIYASAVARCLSGPISPMVRSLVSKVVPTEDLGKVFSLIMTSESLLSLGSSSMYTTIYNATINFNPSVFLYVSAGFYAIEILIAIALIVMRTRKSQNVVYEEIVNERTEDGTEVPSIK